jgi:hypothetical protein
VLRRLASLDEGIRSCSAFMYAFMVKGSMKLEVPDAADGRGHFDLERAVGGIRCFRFTVSICREPRCQCAVVSLACSSAEADDVLRPAGEPAVVELGLEAERIFPAKSSGDARAAKKLAPAIQKEMTPEHWGNFRKLYFDTKMRQTEEADLDKIDCHFPPDVQFDGEMASYHEIFPYAREVWVRRGERRWLFDDQYCVQPDCACRAAVFSFYEEGSSRMRATPVLSIEYDLGSGDVRPYGDPVAGAPSIGAMMEALRAGIPGFAEFVAGRQKQLQHLYNRHIGHVPSSTVRRDVPKVERNDPCPCGTGKKHKKCCGA